MITLNCPSCGGQLELPENLLIAHCIYCGTKILLQESPAFNEQQYLNRYKELCKAALDAKNYDEAIKYCNKILEINPKNADAWIDKAIATFQGSTYENDKYEETMSYLKKASNIMPNDKRISDCQVGFSKIQAERLNKIGLNISNKALNLFQNLHLSNNFEFAKKKSFDQVVQAMEYFLLASNYSPYNIEILNNISRYSKLVYWMDWDNRVVEKIYILGLLIAKNQSIERLPKAREELKNANANLVKIKNQKGFLINSKMGFAYDKIQSLKKEIQELEKKAAFTLPEVQFNEE